MECIWKGKPSFPECKLIYLVPCLGIIAVVYDCTNNHICTDRQFLPELSIKYLRQNKYGNMCFDFFLSLQIQITESFVYMSSPLYLFSNLNGSTTSLPHAAFSHAHTHPVMTVASAELAFVVFSPTVLSGYSPLGVSHPGFRLYKFPAVCSIAFNNILGYKLLYCFI